MADLTGFAQPVLSELVDGSTTVASISTFSGTQDIKLDSTAPTQQFATTGSMSQQTLDNTFNTRYSSNQGFMPAGVGDVVRSMFVFQNNEVLTGSLASLSNRTWQGLRTDSGLSNTTNGLNELYYEITETGFRPLVINQATGIDTVLEAQTTQAQLDNRINEFVDLPAGVTAVAFETYPNLTTSGTSEGTILVEETLQSGKKVQLLVPVTFDRLTAIEITAKPTELLLGTPVNQIDAKQLVEVTLDGQVVAEPLYTSILQNQNAIETRMVGETSAQVLVTYGEVTETLTVPITVKWGSTIQHNGTYSSGAMMSEERIISAYTWHPSKGIRYSPGDLSALGQYLLIEVTFSGNTLINGMSVLSGQQDIRIGSTTATEVFEIRGYATQSTVQTNFNSTYASNNGYMPANVGDVVQSTHYFRNNVELSGAQVGLSNRNWQGLRTDAGLANTVENMNELYYEVTATGFRPLAINQATATTVDLPANATQAYLDSHINDFVDLPQGVTAVGFESYPNLTTEGISNGTILLEETLQSGKKIQTPIRVSFNVSQTLVEVRIPIEMMFHTNDATGTDVAITSSEYQIENRSNVPVNVAVSNVLNGQNYASINQLHFLNTDVTNLGWTNIILNGSLIHLDTSQQNRLNVGQTSNWQFSGQADVPTTETRYPTFDMVFSISVAD